MILFFVESSNCIFDELSVELYDYVDLLNETFFLYPNFWHEP